MKNLLIVGCILFGYSCKSTNMNQYNLVNGFDWQGHRGARGLVPENTIEAMYKAIDLGAVTLEMDAVITADQQVILSHEPFFNHEITTKPDGSFVSKEEASSLNIYQMSYAATQRFDVGLRGNARFPQQQKMAATKPLLLDVITAADAYALSKNKPLPRYNIETKSSASTDLISHPNPKAFVDLLMAVINQKKINDRVSVQSFDIRTLQYLHNTYPRIPTVLLIEGDNALTIDAQINQLGFVPATYSPHYSLVTKEMVAYCKKYKMRLVPWTVNDLSVMKQLRSLGVDGIISDYPNLFYFP